jgi:hypothetical protein
VLSAEAVAILAQVFGAGRSIRVPSSTASAQRFEIIIGLSETCALVDAFGGGAVYLPGLKPKGQPIPRLTLRRVKRLTDRGMSAAQIAQLYGCSARTVYSRRAALKRQEREA